jgi:hypothetical protein
MAVLPPRHCERSEAIHLFKHDVTEMTQEKAYPRMTQMSADKKAKHICVHLRHLRMIPSTNDTP